MEPTVDLAALNSNCFSYRISFFYYKRIIYGKIKWSGNLQVDFTTIVENRGNTRNFDSVWEKLPIVRKYGPNAF